MMDVMTIAAYIWGLAFMVFKVNPLNDPSSPLSRMNYFHPVNVSARTSVGSGLSSEADDCGQNVTVITQADYWSYLCATTTTILITVAYSVLRGIFS